MSWRRFPYGPVQVHPRLRSQTLKKRRGGKDEAGLSPSGKPSKKSKEMKSSPMDQSPAPSPSPMNRKARKRRRSPTEKPSGSVDTKKTESQGGEGSTNSNKIKSILKTPGSPKRKKRRLVFSPTLEEYGETYSKLDYDRSMMAILQYVCDMCMSPLLAQSRFSCPVKGCEFDLCEECYCPFVVKEHKKSFHPNRKKLRFKRIPFEDDE
uniref:Uncharacterized protein n=1 Tax=Lotharella oceanica TaxID=641309 RepID=A0A7S2TPI7_9EUKA|mmetsp:Transcript_22982/g.43176  ORF Transcript_22982/g.43176 Transcript_22982/m.43176 type:complete len:208 (+) Transcript_22982:66-689(+)